MVTKYYVFHEELWFHPDYIWAKSFLESGLKSSFNVTGLNRINLVKGGVYSDYSDKVPS